MAEHVSAGEDKSHNKQDNGTKWEKTSGEFPLPFSPCWDAISLAFKNCVQPLLGHIVAFVFAEFMQGFMQVQP